MDHDGKPEEVEEGSDFLLPIQQHSRPISRMSGDLAFNSNVLTIGIDETDIDQDLMAVARNLGIEIPEEPVESKAEAQSPNVSALTVSSTLNEPSLLPSRTSYSTRPTSVGSDEEIVIDTPKPRHIPIESLIPAAIPLPASAFPSRDSSLAPSRAASRAPSVAPSNAPSRAPSIAPSRKHSYSRAPSIAPSSTAESVVSTTGSMFSIATRSKHSSMASSFTKGLRRLSGFGKRKSNENSIQQLEEIGVTTTGRIRGRSISTPQLPRPSTSDGLPSQLVRSTSTFAASSLNFSSHNIPRKAVGSVLPNYNETRAGRIQRRPLIPTIEEEDLEEMRIAQERSLRNSHLQKLRATQIEEQANFMQEHYARQRKSKDEAKTKWQKAQDVFEKRREDTAAKHEAANMELEMRHLHAELELERLLTSQRKACETKLKYMEAYCRGIRSDGKPEGIDNHAEYPARKVTEEDYRKLVEQYHLRNGMETLHQSRINVLREQQAQQANRISVRQDAELEALSKRHEHESAKLKTEADHTTKELQQEYTNKKSRMIWRWQVKEAIERRRLELERGQVFGELPDILWPEEPNEQDDKILAALGQGQRFSFLMA
ncbi:MAG: hypothetical protein GOMPHAMPRED_005210 [Gomphillus americanus]|uniref:Uncharacterized protein n=1 Tax=Gomphillus americanus TaxID=1940652 RepID=A0A8H3FQ39_9LECA|nr:MAG: hypothetical protein GOMPHAMPRED_005210 [Gomphillus americanus]